MQNHPDYPIPALSAPSCSWKSNRVEIVSSGNHRHTVAPPLLRSWGSWVHLAVLHNVSRGLNIVSPIAKSCFLRANSNGCYKYATGEYDESYLDETNVGGLLTEALTADVQAVLADQTSGVGADAAVGIMSAQVRSKL